MCYLAPSKLSVDIHHYYPTAENTVQITTSDIVQLFVKQNLLAGQVGARLQNCHTLPFSPINLLNSYSSWIINLLLDVCCVVSHYQLIQENGHIPWYSIIQMFNKTSGLSLYTLDLVGCHKFPSRYANHIPWYSIINCIHPRSGWHEFAFGQVNPAQMVSY